MFKSLKYEALANEFCNYVLNEMLIGDMESRINNQERTLSTQLEQVMKIRDDVVTGLRATQGSVLMESSARKLLENHIQTITHIVKQLSRDIQVQS